MASIRLLIADDSAEFRTSVGMMLGLEKDLQLVAMARDGQEALNLAKHLQPEVAVIDVHMPKMDGISAIRALSQVSPWTACIAISYEGDRDTLRQAMASGARDYLIKPFSTDELVNAIRRVAAQRTREQQTSSNTPPATGELKDNLVQRVVLYLRDRRTDDQAAEAYLELLNRAQVEPHILRAFAVVFLTREDWRALRLVCERMEKLTPPGK